MPRHEERERIRRRLAATTPAHATQRPTRLAKPHRPTLVPLSPSTAESRGWSFAPPHPIAHPRSGRNHRDESLPTPTASGRRPVPGPPRRNLPASDHGDGHETSNAPVDDDSAVRQGGLHDSARASRERVDLHVSALELREPREDRGPGSDWWGMSAPEADPDDLDADPVRSPGWLADGGRAGAWWDRWVPERFHGARWDPGRRGVLALAVVGVMAVLITGVVVVRERPVAQAAAPVPGIVAPSTPKRDADAASGSGRASSASEPDADAGTRSDAAGSTDVAGGGELVVSVVGLVHIVGLVHLPSGSRVADALAAAGGARDGADLTGLNLAQRLSDGDQVLVGPAAAEPDGSPSLGSSTTAGARDAQPSGGNTPPTRPGARLNVNTATEAELDALPGVGPVTARAIVSWRTTHGRFTDLEELGDIDGIGPTRLGRLKELLST